MLAAMIRATWAEAKGLLSQLPCELWIVMLVEFFNSLRGFAMSNALYQYMTLEFGFTDVETGWLKGFGGMVGTLCGLSGSLLVDLIGVRKTSIMALSVAVLSRGVFFLARSQFTFKISLLLLAPFGDSVLSTGLYMVALKRLTTEHTRPFAFALQYSIFNAAAAVAGILLDKMRDNDVTAFGLVWSGYRLFVGVTWVVVILAWLLCVGFLHDVELITETDEADGTQKPKVVPFKLPTISYGAEDMAFARREACKLFYTRGLWRVITFSLCTILIGKQWGDLNDVLPPFLERFYGEDVPAFTIASINPTICLVGPPLVALLLAGVDVYDRLLLGLLIMGASPGVMALSPTVASSIVWVILMSLGEILWSPTAMSWTASIAPKGREGLFFALMSLKNLIIGPPSSAFNGWLNAEFNPNCPECRDKHGHFCDTLSPDGGGVCQSQTPVTCVGDAFYNATVEFKVLVMALEKPCPSTCFECPGWTGTVEQGYMLWKIVFLTSLSSPVLVWLFLPFLRGDECSVCGKTLCLAEGGEAKGGGNGASGRAKTLPLV